MIADERQGKGDDELPVEEGECIVADNGWGKDYGDDDVAENGECMISEC